MSFWKELFGLKKRNTVYKKVINNISPEELPMIPFNDGLNGSDRTFNKSIMPLTKEEWKAKYGYEVYLAKEKEIEEVSKLAIEFKDRLLKLKNNGTKVILMTERLGNIKDDFLFYLSIDDKKIVE